MHHGSDRSRHNSKGSHDSDSEDSESAPFHDPDMRFKNLTQRSISEISRESLKLPLWREVDPELKGVVEKYLIDFQRIAIGKIIGKGRSLNEGSQKNR